MSNNFGGALMFILLLFTDCAEAFDKHIRISRQAQRCEVVGQPLQCMNNSAWALPRNRCSCVADDRRIEYRLEDGE